MAGRIAYYGNIVRDGLVLDLDAAKRDSYPGSGTSWRDIAGGVITGSLINGPTFDSGNGGSIVFDGTNDYANLGVNPSCYSPIGFTIDAWVKLTSNTGANPILCIYPGAIVGSGREYVFGTTGGSLYGWVYDNTNGAYRGRSVVITSLISNNTWCNVMMVYNGGTVNSSVKLYLNSTQIDTTDFGANSFTTIRNTSSPMTIGAANDGVGGPINGAASSVKFYTRTLSATEILQNYNALKGRYGL
jgi:hypothetical protein